MPQATPANWPNNHESIGAKGWAFILPTVTKEDADKVLDPTANPICVYTPSPGPSPSPIPNPVARSAGMNNSQHCPSQGSCAAVPK